MLARYFALEDPTRLEPAGRELRVECDLDGRLRLRGVIDRLDYLDGLGVTEDLARTIAIRYDELLRIFFSVALDPTQVDR